MTKIITDDITLRKYIPNVFDTIDNETPLYRKLIPHLEMSEQWICQILIGDKIFETIADGERDVRFDLTATAIAAHAFTLAVPSLDLVLTPNGFGIVNTNNIVPASKERIERLVKSLQLMESHSLEMLLPLLRQSPEWHDSSQCQWLATSIIQDLKYLHGENRSWDSFVGLRLEANAYEQEIAHGWISPELMYRLRHYEATASCPDDVKPVLSQLKRIVIAAVKHGKLPTSSLDDTVTYIRQYPEVFPEWHKSPTSELFTPPKFINEKKSGGYFF